VYLVPDVRGSSYLVPRTFTWPSPGTRDLEFSRTVHSRNLPLHVARKFKILVVQHIDLLSSILPKINFGSAQKNKLSVDSLRQVVQNTGGPKIQNTGGARATSVFCNSLNNYPGCGVHLCWKTLTPPAKALSRRPLSTLWGRRCQPWGGRKSEHKSKINVSISKNITLHVAKM
jgi:hypothetical protein